MQYLTELHEIRGQNPNMDTLSLCHASHCNIHHNGIINNNTFTLELATKSGYYNQSGTEQYSKIPTTKSKGKKK